MSTAKTARWVLLSSALVSTAACNGSRETRPTTASGVSSKGPFDGATGFIDLSRETYSLPSGIAFEGRSIWVSNYVNGGNGSGAPIIYRYDLGSGRSTGSIPSPSQWTTGLAFDGAALLAIDHTDSVRLFRLSPDTGAIISSFSIPESGSYWGIAWDGAYLYVADYVATRDGPSTQISKYSASGEPYGVIYARSGSWWVGTGVALDAIRGLAYGDGSLWALVTPASSGAPFRLLRLSVTGTELSTVDVPDTAGRDLNYLGYDGSFWSIEMLPMSISDFSQGKRLVTLNP